MDCDEFIFWNCCYLELSITGLSNSKQNVVDASTACVDGPYNATTSALEHKEQEESHGSDNSEKNVVDTSTAGVDSPCNATTSYLEMKQQEESHGAGNTEQNVVDASAACVDGPSSGTTSALESNEQEESHGPYSGDIRHHTPDAPLSVCVVDSYTAVAQTLELNKKDLGSGIGNAGQNVVDTSSASVDGPCNLSTSALELKKQEESLGKLSANRRRA